MDKKKSDIEQEVLKTMQSLDGLDTAKTDAFFYTRLEARMENQNAKKPSLIALLFEPQLAFGALAIIMLITVNILSVSNYVQYEEETISSNELTSSYDDYIIEVPILYTENGE